MKWRSPLFWTLSEWATYDKDFYEVSLFELFLSWDACIRGGRVVKHLPHASW